MLTHAHTSYIIIRIAVFENIQNTFEELQTISITRLVIVIIFFLIFTRVFNELNPYKFPGLNIIPSEFLCTLVIRYRK